MPHLRDQFDAGLTLDQIGSSYKTYASQLLEMPEDQINMFEGPYLQAFDNMDVFFKLNKKRRFNLQ